MLDLCWSMPHACGRHILLDLWKKAESVQRRFTKRFIIAAIYLAYRERLVTLGLDRLEVRRLRFDLIYVYKIFLV